METLAALLNGLQATRRTDSANGALVLTTFTVTLFVSALMLFSVQPMFAKMALPTLGGTPAVWAVSMCFFQAVLLAGYCYAHALNRWLSPGRAVAAHLAVLFVTCLALPIGLPASLSEPPAGDAYLWLLGVLALGVGLPFFAVSANAPLLQAWFTRTHHENAADPYFLYGASNLGSLMALIAYPLLIEPGLGLGAQSAIWSAAFAGLGLLIACCGALMMSAMGAPAATSIHDGTPALERQATLVTPSQRFTWLALSALPSGLMVAVTTYITTDIGSAPFVWVVPLALFLTTFILVFKDTLGMNYAWVQGGLPAAILGVILLPGSLLAVLLALLAFFLAAIICHRELYLRRPVARHLTEFYIWMSAGGVIGGIFAALIAPQIFASVIEFKLILMLALLVRPGVLLGHDAPLRMPRILAAGAALVTGFAAYKALASAGLIAGTGPALYVMMALVLAGVFLTRKWTEHRAILVLAMIAGLAVMPGDNNTIYLERSFFGTIRVTETPSGEHRLMLHGTTLHGAERLKTKDGAPVQAPVPATYYYAGSPMARGVELARNAHGSQGRTFTAGIVGLGSGSLACYARAGEIWRYFEIDPMVARVAQNPKYFSFMPRCLPGNTVVIGDARLTLQKEPDASFSYLVIDAFSSDAIPAHLLTREAFEGYFDKLAPGGLIAIHISNRYLDLAPAIAATAATLPNVSMARVASSPTKPVPDELVSRVIFLSKDSALIAQAASWPDGRPLEPGSAQAWTDDYSDVLSALIAGLRR